MNLVEFAQGIVKAASEGASIEILPIRVQDERCILRFRLGTMY